MDTVAKNLVQDRVDQWYDRIRSINSLTEYDCYNLRGHLLDTIDELKATGFNEDDAFEVAAMRLGKNVNLDKEFARTNADILLTRKVILVLSGMMIYFFFYFFMRVSAKGIFYCCHDITINPAHLSWFILGYIIAWHFLLVILTVLFYLKCNNILAYAKALKIKPFHIILLVIFIYSLAILDLEMNQLIWRHVPLNYLGFCRYDSTFGYSGYTFSFSMGICYLILLRKNKKSVIKDIKTEPKNKEIVRQIKQEWRQELEDLKNAGLDDDEATALVLRHKGFQVNKEKEENIDFKSVNSVYIALSGILVYLFLFYLLNSTIPAYLTILQHFDNDPVKNFRWIIWYIVTFNLIIIFFTTSVYIKDRNLLNELRKLNIKKNIIPWIFASDIVLAIIDRFTFPMAVTSLKDVAELKMQFKNIMQYGDLCFSFVILMCFLILFSKYYKENMKVC